MTAILELRHASRRFGGLRALNNVSLSVQPGEIVGLIGPNGAGKTTLVNLVSGAYRPSAGEIWLDGRRIDGLKPHQIARLGMARTYQIVQPFPKMSVLDNVAAGAAFAGGAPDLAAARQQAMECVELLGLAAVAERPAATLTLAYRKRLELAKSLAMRPKMLLLDEVNAGLNPTEIDHALAMIRQIAARGITILLIEHLMKVVMSLCTRVAVLHHGELIAEGKPAEVIADERVIDAYLGARFSKRQPREAGHG